MASFLVRVCCLLACATALADEGGGTIIWARRARTRLQCAAVVARASGGEGHRLPIVSEGDAVGATATALNDVTWWLNGKVLEHKKVATIKTDKLGTYRCGVRTSAGVVLGTELVVQLPALQKKFSVEPADATVATGQPALMQCRIRSSPSANITWLRDQRPLPLDHQRYYQLSNGDLVIANVTSEDAGSYSCNASNVYAPNKTRASRSASLSVSRGPASPEPAFLSDYEPRTLQLKAGEELVLPCLVTGTPRPAVEWRFSGKDETQGAAVSTSPVLRVPGVEARHAGVYACSVVDHTHLNKSWNVSVTIAARIVRPPASQHKPSASVVRFDCQAEGVPEPVITWYKNGEPLQLDGRVKVRKGPAEAEGRLQLVIDTAQPSDAGVYQCFAQSAGTPAATAWGALSVAGGVLATPTGVRCSPLGLKRVRVEWRPVPVPVPVPKRNETAEKTTTPLAAFYYTVHYAPPDCTGACKEQSKLSTPSGSSMDIDLDTAAGRYVFYVRAYYGQDASKPSHKVHCQGQGVPVKVSKQQESVRVEWEQAASGLTDARHWLLQYRSRAAPAAVQNVTLDPDTHRYVLSGVTSEDDYEVRLLTTATDNFLNQNLSMLPWTSTRKALDKKNPPSDTGTDDQKRASIVISNLTVTGQWSRALHLSWHCNACENSASAYSFVICYKRTDPLNTYKSNCNDSYNNDILIGNLEPGTEYEFQVQALLQRRRGAAAAEGIGGGGPFSGKMYAYTLHDESRQIKNVTCTYTESGLYVHWTLVDAAGVAANKRTVYTVHYSQNLTLPLNLWMQRNVTGTTEIELSGLRPDAKTFVMVSSRSRGQEEHGPVVEVPPRFAPSASALTPYALLGVIAGAVVCVICLLCCIALCVWRHRKNARARAQRPGAVSADEGTEMRVTRSGAHANGERRGADEPLLNGNVHGIGGLNMKTTPNGRYKRPAHELVFDLSRRDDDPDTTLDTILELDASDARGPRDLTVHLHTPHPPAADKFPDDNMNCEAMRHFKQGNSAPTLQPNG